MRSILIPIMVALTFLLQACAAIPASETKNRGEKEDFRQKYANRLSVDGIKQQREQKYAQKLAALKRVNPIEDAQRAAAADNYFFWAYSSGRGGRQITPGLVQQQTENSRCRLKQLDGMGDVLFGQNHQQYRYAIRHYAYQFNKTMASFCR